MRNAFAIGLLSAFIAVGFAQESEDKQAKAAPPPSSKEVTEKVTAETARGPLDFAVKDIDGKDVALSKYKSDVVLIVNVASECGLTPQYELLQALHKKFADKGLRILGFPANNFGGQEPGTNEKIKQFCTSEYGVEFAMFAKVSVKGDDCCELYKYLTSPKHSKKFGKPIPWNFTKFLVGRDGKVINRFHPRVKPDAPEIIEAIEAALKEKKPA